MACVRREPVNAGRILVDSGSLEEIEEIVVRDRKHLSEEGVVIPIIAIDKHTGKMESAPEIVSRGLMSENGSELMAGAREIVLKTFELSNLEERADWSVIKEKIRMDLKRYINKQTSKTTSDITGYFGSLAVRKTWPLSGPADARLNPENNWARIKSDGND